MNTGRYSKTSVDEWYWSIIWDIIVGGLSSGITLLLGLAAAHFMRSFYIDADVEIFFDLEGLRFLFFMATSTADLL